MSVEERDAEQSHSRSDTARITNQLLARWQVVNQADHHAGADDAGIDFAGLRGSSVPPGYSANGMSIFCEKKNSFTTGFHSGAPLADVNTP